MRRLIAYDVPEDKQRPLRSIIRRYAYPYQRSVFMGDINGKAMADLLRQIYPIVKPGGHLIVVSVREIEYEIGDPYRWNSRDMLFHRFSRKNSYLNDLDSLTVDDKRIV